MYTGNYSILEVGNMNMCDVLTAEGVKTMIPAKMCPHCFYFGSTNGGEYGCDFVGASKRALEPCYKRSWNKCPMNPMRGEDKCQS